MYRLLSVTGYDSLITQNYVAEAEADLDDIPVIYYGYYKAADEKFYDDSAFENAASSINGLYLDIPTNKYFTADEYGICTGLAVGPHLVDFAVFGSTATVIGTGSGIIVKRLNSKGEWIQTGISEIV